MRKSNTHFGKPTRLSLKYIYKCVGKIAINKAIIPSAIVGQRRNTQGNGQNDFAKPLM
jgi:hypothetical protein